MKVVIAVLLVVHGLIVAAQSGGSFNPGGVINPTWLNWWPVNLGQSWPLTKFGIEHTLFAKAGGIIWLAAGLALVAAGLGILGWVIPTSWWRGLALAGAILSLVMLAVYLHPFYIIGVGASVVLLLALLWEQWPVLEQLGL